ncbi:MAG: activating signal cointegrator 1 complex subunit, partial [Paramarteilia canceri]
LSTTLSNPFDITNWLGGTSIPQKNSALRPIFYNFMPNVRPVPLEILISGFPGENYCPRMATMNKPIFDAIGQYSLGKPVIVFTSSRRQTRFTASSLICQLLMGGDPNQWLGKNFLPSEIERCVKEVSDLNLKAFLPHGN